MKRPIVWLMTFALTFSGSAMTVYAAEDIPIDSKAHTEDAAEIEEAGEYEGVTEEAGADETVIDGSAADETVVDGSATDWAVIDEAGAYEKAIDGSGSAETAIDGPVSDETGEYADRADEAPYDGDFVTDGYINSVPFSYETNEHLKIQAVGRYYNWDGVTNVAQFPGPDGRLCLAADSGSNVKIIRTDENMGICQTLTIKKEGPKFGTAICDKDGNYYIVTGKANETGDTDVNTIFISKYDKSGKLVATVGDNGRSSLAPYYDDEFDTKIPFASGCCDAAISGNILTVNYARKMYGGHQSNSVFSVDIRDMSKVSVGPVYESHSFAQRVVPTDQGFVYASEGDCYDRCFKVYSIKMSGSSVTYNRDHGIFDFWVRDGALDDYNMALLNENFAQMGGLAVLSDGNVAFAASSAVSMNSKAEKETEEIFIQIFDPCKDLSLASSYVTSGERSGLSGPNGRDAKTNHGVKWLTNYGKGYEISNVQIASTAKKEIVVLYELSKDWNYKGVYYITLSETGEVIKPATLISEKARLNPCEMPVTSGEKVFWAGNKHDGGDIIYLYSLDTSLAGSTVDKKVTAKKGLKFNGSPQALVNPGSVTGGHLEYALGKSDSTAPASGKYSADIPFAAKAGTYYVWYKAVGDAYHYDSEPSCVKVKISGTKVKSVSLDRKKATVKKGKTITLKAVISPKNATDKTVTWKSSNKKIATVSKKGRVKGLKKGKVKITVTTRDQKKKATCTVTVK